MAFGRSSQDEALLTYPDLLAWMVDLDWLWTPPVEGERCIQFASYDPGCEIGVGRQEAKPWDPKGWYANIDRGHYLREETRDGKTEYVLADVAGPGAIVRIWSANPTGILYFYFDGATEPTWSAGFEDLTSGKVEPFVEPLAGVRGRGCNFHAPLPFQEHVKVTCSENDHHFQVGVRLLPPGSTVESFRPELLTRYANEIAHARERLLGSPAGGTADETAWMAGTLTMTGDPADPSEWAEEGLEIPGPCIVREVTLDIGLPHLARDRADLLRRILFCVALDGRRTVKVPVGDFFGSAPDFAPYLSYPMSVEPGGKGVCAFPMPVPGTARIYLLADGSLPPTAFELGVRYESRAVPDDALAFHASWHLQKKVRTRPFSDFRVLNAAGPGRFVGCTLVFLNPSIYWWGEGDEKFFVDGERFPSTFGTGTEDYFGYAWADPNPFWSAFHAQPQCDGPDNFGYTCLNRWQLHDQVPFQESFLFDLEIWHWKDVYVDYATTAYWYGRPGASSGLPYVPDPEYRTVDEPVPEAIFRAKGAIEGEVLRVLSVSAGETEAPLMGWYAEERWSNERQLFWKDAGPGDELTLAVPVAEAGLYLVEAVFTSAPDYAVVGVALGGKRLGNPVDLFSPHVVEPTKRIALGEVRLPAGEANLVLRIEGRNERAVPRHLVGLDYLRLTRR